MVVPERTRDLNDEPVYSDALGHHPLARAIGDRILDCSPPYVLGVQGPWGSGKTSFLRKLWAYLGGDPDLSADELRRWYGDNWAKPKNIHPVWFNPWHHQFEAHPMSALLQEIRKSVGFATKAKRKAAKITDVTVYSALSLLGDLSSMLPKMDPKKIVERGREYEAEQFDTVLSSQRFRDYFEGAIGQAIGQNKTMVIFIDDLDRCEANAAYRLLESLKLYLNAKNCIYVLGLDQKHLEEIIAGVFAGKDKPWRFRPVAREYLGKMFQCQFLLPTTPDISAFIEDVLNFENDGSTLR